MNPFYLKFGPFAWAWDDWTHVGGYRRVWWRLWRSRDRRWRGWWC